MPRSRSSVVNRQLVGGLVAAVVLLVAASAWQLARSQADSREALRDRFGDRAPVATAVVDGFFRAVFTGQGEALTTPDFNGPRVPRAALDALASRNKSLFVLVTDSRGRVLGASSNAPVARRGVWPVDKTVMRSGYGLSDVRPGRTPAIVSSIRFGGLARTRVLVSASPAKAYMQFLNTTLKPIVRSGGSSAFVVDGRGRAIAAVGRHPSVVRRLRDLPANSRTGEFDSGEGTQLRRGAGRGSHWRTVLSTPTASLYAPGGGSGRWLPWVILVLLAAALLAGLQLVRRLVDTSRRLSGANADLELVNENLGRSNADLEQFAYIASHDLSSPLRSVAGFSQMLAKRYRGRLDDEADQWIGFIENGVTRMQRIIDDLLQYSRVDQVDHRSEPVDLQETLDEVLLWLAPTLEERHAEITSDPLPAVLGDATQLSQVLQNLIDNATTYVAPGVDPSVHVGAERRRGMCRVTVTDNGVGVDPEHAERIFKMFQRLHTQQEHPGSGIGLAIAKKIVERHGGRISIEPAPGGGCTFAFQLPLAPRTAPVRERVLQR